MGKIGPKFSHLLTVRAEGADPPITVRKKNVFFYDSSIFSWIIFCIQRVEPKATADFIRRAQDLQTPTNGKGGKS